MPKNSNFKSILFSCLKLHRPSKIGIWHMGLGSNRWSLSILQSQNCPAGTSMIWQPSCMLHIYSYSSLLGLGMTHLFLWKITIHYYRIDIIGICREFDDQNQLEQNKYRIVQVKIEFPIDLLHSCKAVLRTWNVNTVCWLTDFS